MKNENRAASKWLGRAVLIRACLSIVLAALAGLLPGCLGLTAYVDPQSPKFSYADVAAGQKGVALGVLVEFQTDGKPNAAATASTRDTVLDVFKTSQVFPSVSSGTSGTDAQLRITINNTGGSTSGSAVVTVLTFGGLGTATVDRYEITSEYMRASRPPVTGKYGHAIHCTIGNRSGPSGLQPMTVTEAVNTMLKEVTLQIIHDLQSENAL